MQLDNDVRLHSLIGYDVIMLVSMAYDVLLRVYSPISESYLRQAMFGYGYWQCALTVQVPAPPFTAAMDCVLSLSPLFA
jgi:hypothetical protein